MPWEPSEVRPGNRSGRDLCVDGLRASRGLFKELTALGQMTKYSQASPGGGTGGSATKSPLSCFRVEQTLQKLLCFCPIALVGTTDGRFFCVLQTRPVLARH